MTSAVVPPPSVAKAVFDAVPGARGNHLGVATLATLCLHLAFGAVLMSVEPSLEQWSAELALAVHSALSQDVIVEAPAALVAPEPAPETPPIEPSPPPPPPPPPPPSPAHLPPKAAARATAPEPSSEPSSSVPTRAARVLVRAAEAENAVDTGFVRGDADPSAGGETAESGEVPTKPPTPEAATSQSPPPESPSFAPPTPDAGPRRSRAVSLAAGRWRCDWPAKADDAQIDEQSVVVRVFVDVDGNVLDVRVQVDPGDGFGEAAAVCARAATLRPALDSDGRPVAAWSPPIRVRFSR